MSVNLSTDSLDETIYSSENYFPLLSRWYGRDLSYDLPKLLAPAVCRIAGLLSLSKDVSLKRPIIEKHVALLLRKSNGWTVQQSGWAKKLSKGWKSTWNKTCDFASDAWKSTCEVAQKTCEVVQEFWEDHKKEIIIGACVVAAAAAVITVTVYTGGTGTQAAVVGSTALINSLASDSPEEERNSPSALPEFPTEGISIAEDLSPITSHPIEALPPVLFYQEIVLPSEAVASVPEVPSFTYQPAYSQLTLETLYGKDYVSRLYEQFGLTDPYFIPPQINPTELLSPTQQFVHMIESKLKEARDPSYAANLLSTESRPSPNQQFAHLIGEKLKEVQDPAYLDSLLAREPKHSSQEFRDWVGGALSELDEARYMASLKWLAKTGHKIGKNKLSFTPINKKVEGKQNGTQKTQCRIQG